MNLAKPALVLAAAAFATVVLAGCEKEGPMERAGKKVDNTVEKAGAKIEKAGDKIENAVKK